jgi:ATP-dependent protease ClpP protease subunit
MAELSITGEIGPATVALVRIVLARCDADEILWCAIDSPGGRLDSSIKIADLVRSHRGSTFARVKNKADSGAALVFSAFKSRTAEPGATFHFHEVATTEINGRLTATRLYNRAVELEEANTEYREMMSSYTGIDVSTIVALQREETTLTARNAVEIGLATYLAGCPALTKAARQRREAKAARSRLTMPGAAAARFTPAELRALAATLPGTMLGIAPAALKAMLQDRRP